MAYTPNPTLLTTGTGTGNVLSTRRPLDISNDIAYYNPNANPFFLLAQQADKKALTDPEFKCLENQMQPVFDAVNNVAGYAAGATSIVVDHGSYFKAQDLVLVTRTGEIFKVSSLSSNTLTVVRGYGSVAAAAINDNDELRRVGNCFEEGAAADSAKTVKVDAVTNYAQIFKTSLEVTGTIQKTTLYGGPQLVKEQKDKGIEHAMKIESAFLFGQRAEYLTTSATNATTTHPLRLTGGILYYISSNAVSIGGALSEASFNNDFLRYVFTADKNFRQKRTLFVSALVGGIMNQWANGKIQLVPSDKTFGIRVNRYLSFYGEVNVVLHPLLEGDVYSGYAIAADLENVGYRHLRDTMLEEDIVQDGTDKRTDQFLTEAGLMVRLEGVHGYAYGITG